MKLRTKILIFIIFNVLLFILLFNMPIESEILKNICLIKFITRKECWNCGMTRAFLSVIHLDFLAAYSYNNNVVIVFPYVLVAYLNLWYKYIFERRGLK